MGRSSGVLQPSSRRGLYPSRHLDRRAVAMPHRGATVMPQMQRDHDTVASPHRNKLGQATIDSTGTLSHMEKILEALEMVAKGLPTATHQKAAATKAATGGQTIMAKTA